MNEFIKEMNARRSVRTYKETPVEKAKIEEICEAGLYAASGMGKQSPIILAVTNKELRDRLSKMNAAVMNASNDPFYGAPNVLIVLADKNIGTAVYDGSLTMGNMMLAAHALGVSSCWIHRAKQMFESEEGKEILKNLGVEGEYEGIGCLIIGYSDDQPVAKPRNEGRVFFAE